jgi:hypothetical protein
MKRLLRSVSKNSSFSKKEQKEREKIVVELPKKDYKLINDNFKSYADLEIGLRKAGLEACQLVVGIDFTRSNTWQGGPPYFENENLHALLNREGFWNGEPAARNPIKYNPYQHVLHLMCQALAPFDDDNLIPAYGFGDTRTTDKYVFPITNDIHGQEIPCQGLEGVLHNYNIIVEKFHAGLRKMSGPTSFAPIINKTIEIVNSTKLYHILLIICDGAVTNEAETIEAIVRASKYPISIVCIGVGKGPWHLMREFDDRIPTRDFDNFQFVPFYDIMQQCENDVIEFAKHALMEVPEQYEYIKMNIMSPTKK